MQTASKEGLTERARALASMLDAIPSCSVEVVRTSARIGGGAAPTVELEGRGLRFQGPDAASLASWLRAGDPPVIARIEDGAVVVDLTAVAPEDDRRLGAALRAALEHADD
jgi:L-seryl-tRNA(Ser) seleniumtransferase